jgi:hypothetical protein
MSKHGPLYDYIFNPIPEGYEKKFVAVRLGVIYDSQASNKKWGGLPARTSTPLWRNPIGRLGVVYDSQPARIQKIPPETGGCSYILIETSTKTNCLYIKTFNKK